MGKFEHFLLLYAIYMLIASGTFLVLALILWFNGAPMNQPGWPVMLGALNAIAAAEAGFRTWAERDTLD